MADKFSEKEFAEMRDALVGQPVHELAQKIVYVGTEVLREESEQCDPMTTTKLGAACVVAGILTWRATGLPTKLLMQVLQVVALEAVASTEGMPSAFVRKAEKEGEDGPDHSTEASR